MASQFLPRILESLNVRALLALDSGPDGAYRFAYQYLGDPSLWPKNPAYFWPLAPSAHSCFEQRRAHRREAALRETSASLEALLRGLTALRRVAAGAAGGGLFAIGPSGGEVYRVAPISWPPSDKRGPFAAAVLRTYRDNLLNARVDRETCRWERRDRRWHGEEEEEEEVVDRLCGHRVPCIESLDLVRVESSDTGPSRLVTFKLSPSSWRPSYTSCPLTAIFGLTLEGIEACGLLAEGLLCAAPLLSSPLHDIILSYHGLYILDRDHLMLREAEQ